MSLRAAARWTLFALFMTVMVAAGAPGRSSAAPISMAVAAAGAPNPDVKAPSQAYLLGPEDVIEVAVLGRTDFTTRAKIGPDGNIELPYLSSVQAGNRTVAELRDQVRRALEAGGFFSKPIVTVNVVSYASRYVTVLGQVGTPGLVPVDRPYRLSELLARVGGTKDDAAEYVVLRSGKAPERRLTVNALATGDESDDPFVSPGDKIYVPRSEVFFISGQIKTPGAYPVLSGMTLRMAISRGGGLTDSGSEGRIKLTRKGKRVSHLDLDAKVEADDVIVVGERLF